MDILPGSRPADPTALDPNAPDPRYGGNVRDQNENPEWMAWNQAANAARAQYGFKSPEHLAALQNEPQRYADTALGTDVNAVKAAGANAAQTLADDSAGIRASGIEANDQGQAVADVMDQRGRAAQDRVAPGAQRIRDTANIAADRINDIRPDRSGIDALNKFAQGPAGPSAAEAQLRMQSDRDRRAALSLARSARGGPAAVALALRRAQSEGAAISAETRGQAGILRATEEATARGQNLQALTDAGKQIGVADATQVTAATAAGNIEVQGQTEATGAELQQIGLNDNQTATFATIGENARQAGINARATAEANGMSGDQAAAAVQLEYATLAWQMLTTEQQAEINRMAIAAGVVAANKADARAQEQQTIGFFGTLLSAGSNLFGGSGGGGGGGGGSGGGSNGNTTINTLPYRNDPYASDRRVKTAVTKLRGIASDLRKTPGHEWTYKDEAKHGKGRYTGAMAQDLEKTRTFRSAVKEGPDGVKMVDGARLAMSHQAALHDLQKQVDRLSGLVKAKKGAAETPDEAAVPAKGAGVKAKGGDSANTSTESETSTSTETSTVAHTTGNFTATVTGGAGKGANTTVNIHAPPNDADKKKKAAAGEKRASR